MTLLAEIKKGILSELALKGWGYVMRTDRLIDEAVRALAELIVEGLILEGDYFPDGGFTIFITRKGAEAAEQAA